jgi:17beta-estradiol 17-dehydrogenase / very-long-chain 3-oxoacyl-CoA reductase
MVEKKNGLIINVGSAAGTIPSGLLAVYSASKAFLRYWSISLSSELKGKGVEVQHITTYFVATAMSKIRKTSWTTPSPKSFVRSVFNGIGAGGQSAVAADVAPYPSHSLVHFVFEHLPEWFKISFSFDMHKDIRKRALKKKERESMAPKKEE